MSPKVFPRGMEPSAVRRWRTTPVLRIEGPRGVGKTTLARSLVPTSSYVTLADPNNRRIAQGDLRGWLESLPIGTAIDEAQLVPDLSVLVKSIVDERNGQPSQFLLTGSSALPTNELGGSDPLVGRVASIRMEPFSQSELESLPRDTVSALFDDDPGTWSTSPETQASVFSRFSAGGMPTLRKRELLDRETLLDDYVRSLFRTDVHPTDRNVEGLLRLFTHLSAKSSQLENLHAFARDIEVSGPTAHAYLDTLQRVFMVFGVPGYRPDPAKRVTSKRRLFTVDPVFASHHLRLESDRLFNDTAHGGYLETIVATELRRVAQWTTSPVTFAHWRQKDHHEVDLVMERRDGRVVGIEVKWARSIGPNECKGLREFRNRYPAQFHKAFVFHPGDRVTRIENDLWAVPLSVLWTVGAPVVEPRRSLTERLEKVRVQIIREQEETAAQHLLEGQLQSERNTNARAKLNGATALFEQLIPGLTELGLQPSVVPIDQGLGSPWRGAIAMTLNFSNGQATLSLQARITRSDEIEWLVNLTQDTKSEAYGEMFTTSWNEDPTPMIEERLGLFIDALPALTKPKNNRHNNT